MATVTKHVRVKAHVRFKDIEECSIPTFQIYIKDTDLLVVEETADEYLVQDSAERVWPVKKTDADVVSNQTKTVHA